MSQELISRSPDLKRLRDEGYEIEVRSGFLLVTHVPFVAPNRQVQFGILISTLDLAGEVTTRPGTHVMSWSGEVPCHSDGSRMTQILSAEATQTLAPGLTATCSFSSKPPEGYRDYFDKMTTYIRIISGPPRSIDPNATATTFAVVEDHDPQSVFQYLDTASSRANIVPHAGRLALSGVAIIGLGGTGSYVLDLVAKTPVREIHLFDGDAFRQHNAFRAPGAPSLEELRREPSKVAHFAEVYSHMHRHVVPHDYFIDESSVEQLRGLGFVFLCSTGGPTKKSIVTSLDRFGVPFIDVGIGVHDVDGLLTGAVRVTTSTELKRDHVWSRQCIPFSDVDDDDGYSSNIQIADLNALNAALAVIKWKKLCGFYVDQEQEHFSVYQISGNHLINESRP